MKALPWYFGSPSEVMLTQAGCCDGLHYGVYGLWGSAPSDPAGLLENALPRLSQHARPTLEQTADLTDDLVSLSESALRKKYTMCLILTAATVFHILRESTRLDSVTAARPLLPGLGLDGNTVAALAVMEVVLCRGYVLEQRGNEWRSALRCSSDMVQLCYTVVHCAT